MRFLLILLCGLTVGCGSGSPYSYVKTPGKISYDDGTPIPSGSIRLQFAAQDAPAVEGSHPRPAIANVNAQGEFDCVTSYKYGDGLIRGKHKVAIEQAADSCARNAESLMALPEAPAASQDPGRPGQA